MLRFRVLGFLVFDTTALGRHLELADHSPRFHARALKPADLVKARFGPIFRDWALKVIHKSTFPVFISGQSLSTIKNVISLEIERTLFKVLYSSLLHCLGALGQLFRSTSSAILYLAFLLIFWQVATFEIDSQLRKKLIR